jgi:hypothetical protein
MIYWSGRSTSGASHWKATTDNFIHLYEELEHQGVISTEDGDPYDLAILKKYNKSFEDAEFLNEDDEIDYNKVQSFLNSHSLTDKEIWQLIESENGNAYYQTFERKTDENIFEICDKDFDDDGEYLYYE